MGNINILFHKFCCLHNQDEQPEIISGLKLFHYEIWIREQIKAGKLIAQDNPDTGVFYQVSEIR